MQAQLEQAPLRVGQALLVLGPAQRRGEVERGQPLRRHPASPTRAVYFESAIAMAEPYCAPGTSAIRGSSAGVTTPQARAASLRFLNFALR